MSPSPKPDIVEQFSAIAVGNASFDDSNTTQSTFPSIIFNTTQLAANESINLHCAKMYEGEYAIDYFYTGPIINDRVLIEYYVRQTFRNFNPDAVFKDMVPIPMNTIVTNFLNFATIEHPTPDDIAAFKTANAGVLGLNEMLDQGVDYLFNPEFYDTFLVTKCIIGVPSKNIIFITEPEPYNEYICRGSIFDLIRWVQAMTV